MPRSNWLARRRRIDRSLIVPPTGFVTPRAAAPAGPVLTPDLIFGANLFAWFDAQDDATLTLTGGTTVTAWADKVGSNDLELWVGDGSAGPELSTIGGWQALLFGAGVLHNAAFVLATPWTVIAVAADSLAVRSNTSAACFWTPSSYTSVEGDSGSCVIDPAPATNPSRLIFHADEANSYVRDASGVIAVPDGLVGTREFDPLYVGGQPGQWEADTIGELMFVSGNVSPAQRAELVRYFAQHWEL
jgi:hypothetical protein